MTTLYQISEPEVEYCPSVDNGKCKWCRIMPVDPRKIVTDTCILCLDLALRSSAGVKKQPLTWTCWLMAICRGSGKDVNIISNRSLRKLAKIYCNGKTIHDGVRSLIK